MKKLLSAAILIFLMLVALLVAGSNLGLPGSYKIYSVQSGSMEPAIKQGSLVFVKQTEEYAAGDIITYLSERRDGNKIEISSTTHRIAKVSETEGIKQYFTIGDANEVEDPFPVSEERVVGKVDFSIPLIGYVVNFSRTLYGIIFLIVIPATIIVYSEILNIKNEAKRLMAERKKRKLTTKEKIIEAIGEEEIKIEKEAKKELRGIGKLFSRFVKA